MSDSLRKRASMRDVAGLAGVSATTASMILNGKDSTFPEETRRRVRDAAVELGYRVDRIARNLVRQKSELIGVVVEFIDNPFLASVAAYLNRTIQSRGYRALFEVTELNADSETLNRSTDALLDWRIDGLLHWWTESYALGANELDQRKEGAEDDARGKAPLRGTPAVYFGSASAGERVDCVYLDDYAGARLVVTHLLEMGHRRIGHLSSKASTCSARTRALVDAVREAGLPEPVVRECPSEAAEEAKELAYELAHLPVRPTALVCHNDVMALGALRGLRDAGLNVPTDISVVGYDDSWASRYAYPALTTVEFPYVEIVDIAVDTLFGRIAGAESKPIQRKLTGKLIVRESTGPPN